MKDNETIVTNLTEMEAREVYGDLLPAVPELIGTINEEDFLKEDAEDEQE